MEDTVSRSSVESSSTGEDFVMVNGDPKLKITGDINDINEEITDDSSIDFKMASTPISPDMSDSCTSNQPDHVIPSSQSVDVLNTHKVSNMNSSMDESKSGIPESEHILKHPWEHNWNYMDRGRSVSLPVTPNGDATIFHGVTYLGCATVNAPRSEVEIYRNMAVLNEQSQMSIPVILSVPSTSEGIVRLLDPTTNSDIASYRIHRILFCARGPTDSNERRCFAFTCSHGDTAETTIFQCHVFRCDLPEAVAKVLYCFATTFRRVPKQPRSESISSLSDSEQKFIFSVGLEFKEDDSRGNFSTVPRDKSCFKLRCNMDKKIIITVQQNSLLELKIERCFGLLLSPGRNVKHGDMQLIEMECMGNSNDGKSYIISGHWDPTEPSFTVLNSETEKDNRVFLTIAVDLVISGIQEPVRFAIETKAKIFPQTERFWYFTKKPHYEQFHLKLKQMEGSMPCESKYEVITVESQTEIDRKKTGLGLGLTTSKHLHEDIQTPQEPDEESDGDEPLLSGSGAVSKDVTDENILEAWHDVLTKWHQNLSMRPKQVSTLARKGIPEALRGEVWQLLAGCDNNIELLEAYRILITKESPNEQVILRDINRTFPAHDFFKESGGVGQDSLYKISKAYSVYDEEVGYCQGLSFLAAALLLHMPEEQAFCVLVKIMFDYGLRDLFKQGFEELHLKFYQIQRFMHDLLPDLYNHFMDMGLEAHMFASQWFLTLFTAKFPLHMVFHVLDLYLSEGKDVIFNIALALLKMSRKDLLALDFEGVLKYFRVHLPKRYRSEDTAKELLLTAIGMKVTVKRLKKYEKEYLAQKEQELQQEDPSERIQRENYRLQEENLRLEQENDDLAHELVTSKLTLSNNLELSEIRCDQLEKDCDQTKKMLTELEEEKRRLELESQQVKEMCRRELDRTESEINRNSAIINDYKQICSQLSERLEKQQTASKEEVQRIKNLVKSCDSCGNLFDDCGKLKICDIKMDPEDINPTIVELERQVRELELELAQTKLALVESQCKTQDLTHQLNATISELQASKNTWFQKTITSFREATAKKDIKE
ncbi:rab GTPase-activating protein 1 isoform X2 [Octopus bimaculoides]|uniref:Rab-GAP TBC domain-containing protein n=1 Tax=Octopus bimaculoides TaxID=37653 RepID=A0A0L8GR89_OCTBM|nr:rab GTPase-activating protein 1 isoform X2 [Octopus bimaculoides]|eukprot:XP_014778828.1 PREDICTED: rab GTPase-activating protein 1-like isoform X2 [Octopus bimaculoides]